MICVNTCDGDKRESSMEPVINSVVWYKERCIHLFNKNHIQYHIYPQAPSGGDRIPYQGQPNTRSACLQS